MVSYLPQASGEGAGETPLPTGGGLPLNVVQIFCLFSELRYWLQQPGDRGQRKLHLNHHPRNSIVAPQTLPFSSGLLHSLCPLSSAVILATSEGSNVGSCRSTGRDKTVPPIQIGVTYIAVLLLPFHVGALRARTTAASDMPCQHDLGRRNAVLGSQLSDCGVGEDVLITWDGYH